MPTLDATVGGATANSFATIEAADEYLDARLNAEAWDTDDDSKTRALIEATRDLSNLEPLYQGFRTDSVQVLAFPRRLVINRKAPWQSTIGLTGYPEYADDIIPPDLMSATIELALEYLKAGETDLAVPSDERNTIEDTVGPLTTRWASPQDQIAPAQGIARFPRVMMLITPLFEIGYSNAVVRS